ncbi:chaplin [Streptomyces sp. NPDC058964]|uniref:chaplin n=1 Tax=Streptomyces sp. NPDC058964 TaxID=3346681 RepID=UPI0036C8FEF8
MRIRAAALTAVLTGALTLAGTTAAQAADPDPVTGTATNSPGLLSGDVIQVPVNIPVLVCGDSINLIGLMNPTSGNTCSSS